MTVCNELEVENPLLCFAETVSAVLSQQRRLVEESDEILARRKPPLKKRRVVSTETLLHQQPPEPDFISDASPESISTHRLTDGSQDPRRVIVDQHKKKVLDTTQNSHLKCTRFDASSTYYYTEVDSCCDSEVEVPAFRALVNFPEYILSNRANSSGSPHHVNRNRHCVMCGKAANGVNCQIPKQNKGLCKTCDVAVWEVRDCITNESNAMLIKWCKGCKNFRFWSSFGSKQKGTKCTKCRQRQKIQYIRAKEVKSPDSVATTAIVGATAVNPPCVDKKKVDAAIVLTNLLH